MKVHWRQYPGVGQVSLHRCGNSNYRFDGGKYECCTRDRSKLTCNKCKKLVKPRKKK